MNQALSIQSLLNADITWTKDTDASKWYGHFGGAMCELTLGNFPAEPLYTLVWDNQTLEFDDTPPRWNLPRN